MISDAERLASARHDWRYVKLFLENTGSPTLKIHLAPLEGALREPEPEPEPTPVVPAFYRPHRICVNTDALVEKPNISADLLDRAAVIMNELTRRGAFNDTTGDGSLTYDVARWFSDYDGLAHS